MESAPDHDPENENDGSLNHGPQPLDALLTELGLENGDLVEASTEQLTYKVVGKARRGRELTSRAQKKVLAAVRAALKARGEKRLLELADLFNYGGR